MLFYNPAKITFFQVEEDYLVNNPIRWTKKGLSREFLSILRRPWMKKMQKDWVTWWIFYLMHGPWGELLFAWDKDAFFWNKGVSQLEEKWIPLSAVLKGAKRAECLVWKSVWFSAGVKAASLLEQSILSFSEIIKPDILAKYTAARVVEEKCQKKRPLNVFNVRSGRSWAWLWTEESGLFGRKSILSMLDKKIVSCLCGWPN